MTKELMTWGRHPDYANGQWIKLAAGNDKAEYRYRKQQGFILRTVPLGTHPDTNPHPKQAGYGLRLHHAEQAIKRLAVNPQADIYSRAFDDCFEMGDGDAVVWELMHRAHQEPDQYGQSPLTEGIQAMFRSSLNGLKYPQLWQDIYEKMPQTEQKPPSEQLSLF